MARCPVIKIPGFGPGGSYADEQGSEYLDLICAVIKKKDMLVITVAYELNNDSGTRFRWELRRYRLRTSEIEGLRCDARVAVATS